MKRLIAASAAALFCSLGAAQAVTIAGIVLDDNAFADGAVLANTVSGTRGPADFVDVMADGDLGTGGNLNDSFVEIFFTDNVLINGPGLDLVLFTNGNNNVIRVGTGPTINDPSTATVTGSINVPASDPFNPLGYGISAQRIDLSALGFAEGAEITDGLFLSRGGVFTTVYDVAALNSRDVVMDPDPDPANVVPLPAGLPLVLSAIGAFGLVRRRRG